MKKIILFYKYATVQDVIKEQEAQKELCNVLNLKGRIILAHEGVNGTLCGSEQAITKYIKTMNDHPVFNAIEYKFSDAQDSLDYFPKLKVMIRDEIVHLGVEDGWAKIEQTGTYLTPEQVHELLQKNPEDLVVLDTRNNYESSVGAFKDAIKPDIKYFRDFPKYVDDHIDEFKDKKVFMYCTGGVRCERATAYLKEKNVAKEVMQLAGGIHKYAEKYPDGFFRGKNYVFDNRVTVKVNDDVLGQCSLCSVACDEYTNCANATCNSHFISCIDCVKRYDNACSQQCMELLHQEKVQRRPDLATVVQQKRAI